MHIYIYVQDDMMRIVYYFMLDDDIYQMISYYDTVY